MSTTRRVIGSDTREKLAAGDISIEAAEAARSAYATADAGRAYALSIVVAGLVDAPPHRPPVSTGYGHCSDDEAATAKQRP